MLGGPRGTEPGVTATRGAVLLWPGVGARLFLNDTDEAERQQWGHGRQRRQTGLPGPLERRRTATGL